MLTREAFEAEAEKRGLWARLLPPLETALAQANLTKEQIHRVEVVGGATRILKVKETALAFFGRKQLDGSLNGDEAAALVGLHLPHLTPPSFTAAARVCR